MRAKRPRADLVARSGKTPAHGFVLSPVRSRPPRNLEEARKDVDLLSRNGRICRFLIGYTVNWVRDHDLFGPKYGSPKEFMRSFKHPSLRTLYECSALADSVPGDVVEAYDLEQIELGIQLLPKTPSGDVFVSKTALAALRIRVERDGKRLLVAFAEASVEELVAAVLDGRKRTLPEFPAEFVNKVERLSRRMGEGVTALGSVRRQRQGSQNVAVITVLDDRLDDFLAHFD